MDQISNSNNSLNNTKGLEILIQVGIAVALFLSMSVKRNGYDLQLSQLVFLLNYLIAGLAINYYLLPQFYYKQEYVKFGIGVILTIVASVLVEEFILEKVFFPDTRGSRFTGIFFNFMQMLPTIMLFVGFKFAWDAQRKNRELSQLKEAVTGSQLQFLKSQINPHFLFNSLNNLYSYALEKSEKTPGIILELSSLLRYMLYDCREAFVPLEKEAKYLNDFVRLQGLQIEERGDIKFTVSDNFKGYQVAPLILIVFVENCFKHTTSSQSDKITIDIDLSLDNDTIHLKCKNSFDAASNSAGLTTKGIGLENVITRLDLLYPNQYKLNVDQSGGYYTVDLAIEINRS